MVAQPSHLPRHLPRRTAPRYATFLWRLYRGLAEQSAVTSAFKELGECAHDVSIVGGARVFLADADRLTRPPLAEQPPTPASALGLPASASSTRPTTSQPTAPAMALARQSSRRRNAGKVQEYYRPLVKAAVLIQAGARRFCARNERRKRASAVAKINQAARQHRAHGTARAAVADLQEASRAAQLSRQQRADAAHGHREKLGFGSSATRTTRPEDHRAHHGAHLTSDDGGGTEAPAAHVVGMGRNKPSTSLGFGSSAARSTGLHRQDAAAHRTQTAVDGFGFARSSTRVAPGLVGSATRGPGGQHMGQQPPPSPPPLLPPSTSGAGAAGTHAAVVGAGHGCGVVSGNHMDSSSDQSAPKGKAATVAMGAANEDGIGAISVQHLPATTTAGRPASACHPSSAPPASCNARSGGSGGGGGGSNYIGGAGDGRASPTPTRACNACNGGRASPTPARARPPGGVSSLASFGGVRDASPSYSLIQCGRARQGVGQGGGSTFSSTRGRASSGGHGGGSACGSRPGSGSALIAPPSSRQGSGVSTPRWSPVTRGAPRAQSASSAAPARLAGTSLDQSHAAPSSGGTAAQAVSLRATSASAVRETRATLHPRLSFEPPASGEARTSEWLTATSMRLGTSPPPNRPSTSPAALGESMGESKGLSVGESRHHPALGRGRQPCPRDTPWNSHLDTRHVRQDEQWDTDGAGGSYAEGGAALPLAEIIPPEGDAVCPVPTALGCSHYSGRAVALWVAQFRQFRQPSEPRKASLEPDLEPGDSCRRGASATRRRMPPASRGAPRRPRHERPRSSPSSLPTLKSDATRGLRDGVASGGGGPEILGGSGSGTTPAPPPPPPPSWAPRASKAGLMGATSQPIAGLPAGCLPGGSMRAGSIAGSVAGSKRPAIFREDGVMGEPPSSQEAETSALSPTVSPCLRKIAVKVDRWDKYHSERWRSAGVLYQV